MYANKTSLTDMILYLFYWHCLFLFFFKINVQAICYPPPTNVLLAPPPSISKYNATSLFESKIEMIIIFVINIVSYIYVKVILQKVR